MIRDSCTSRRRSSPGSGRCWWTFTAGRKGNRSHDSGRSNYLLNELGDRPDLSECARVGPGTARTFSLLDNGFKRDDTYKDINALFDWIANASRDWITSGSR